MTRALTKEYHSPEDYEKCKEYLRLTGDEQTAFAKNLSAKQSNLCIRVLDEYKASYAFLSCRE